VKLRGLDLHVVDEGSGSPPLLLLHGFTGASLDWADVQPTLAASRRVVAYDQRGHGQSTNTGAAGDYTFDELVADLAAMIDELDLAPLHLLGHSMGGVVTLRYALERPETLRSLVLMDTMAAPTSVMPRGVVEGLAATARDQGMDALLGVMWPFMERLLADQPEARRAVLRSRMERKIPNMDPEAFVALGAALGEFPSMVDRLGELTMPVTVLVGENDLGLRAAADLMADRIPGAELAVVPHAGHSPQEDDPAAWLRAMDRHLAR
jgi:pimeloyl-ACP methyl ester carboxylesterase